MFAPSMSPGTTGRSPRRAVALDADRQRRAAAPRASAHSCLASGEIESKTDNSHSAGEGTTLTKSEWQWIAEERVLDAEALLDKQRLQTPQME
jgi:hypothetical protein